MPSRNLENKTVNLHLTYKLVNNTVGVLSNAQMATLNQERNAQIVSSLGNKDSHGNLVTVTFSESYKSTIVREYNISYDTKNVDDFKNMNPDEITWSVLNTNGMADNSDNTQVNRTQINVYTTEAMPHDANGNLLLIKEIVVN